MELTIENLRTLASSGEIFLTAHSQARLYERGILLADIRQAIQSGKIIEIQARGLPLSILPCAWRESGWTLAPCGVRYPRGCAVDYYSILA